MSGLIESAAGILSGSERRLEAVAQNVANVSTPGYKRQISFTQAPSAPEFFSTTAQLASLRSDLAQGRLTETGNPLDLAISGDGFFRLRRGEGFVYTRQGQFQLAEDGRVVSPQGDTLQEAGGGDLVLPHISVEILPDGTILDAGQPIARVALFTAAEDGGARQVGGSYFVMADEAVEEAPAGVEVRQAMVEASNVSLGDEMIEMMAALRQAETGARLVQLYDELVGRAVTTFSEAGR